MKYKLLGRSGLRVSELCLGTMTFGEEFGWGNSKDESRKVFDEFVEKGGNFFDTANYYTKGTSEKFLGEFIAKSRDRYVLATKYSLNTNPDDPNAGGNHRKNMMHALHASLKRLNTDYIDVYWIHAWDFTTPLEEVMRALDDCVRAGKVNYVGISDTPAWIVSRSNAIAELRGWTPFVALQLEYSLIERTIEREFVPMAKALDLAILAWSPLGMGVLTGKYSKGPPSDSRFQINPTMGERFLKGQNRKIADTVLELSKEIGLPAGQIAINWVRQQCGVVIPIVGAKNAEQLRENLGCLEFELTDEHMHRLNEISKIDGGFPHEFLDSPGIKKIIYGNYVDKIENHHSLMTTKV